MTIIIIEDNPVLQANLEKKLLNIDSSFDIAAKISTVKQAVEWFSSNAFPDLVFMDIQLEDGMCFEIFDQIKIDCPIVFITSFNDYAIKAFELNGIDYIIKPAEESRLKQSIEKYKGLEKKLQHHNYIGEIKKILTDASTDSVNSSVKRILVYKGEHIIPIDSEDIAYFYFEGKKTILVTHEDKRFVVNHSLEIMETMLNPENFFRANRQFLLSLTCIKDIISSFSNKLKIVVYPSSPEEIIISKEKAHSFKEWLNG